MQTQISHHCPLKDESLLACLAVLAWLPHFCRLIALHASLPCSPQIGRRLPFFPCATAGRGHRGYKKLGAAVAATNSNLGSIPHAHSEPRSAPRRPSLSAGLHRFETTYPLYVDCHSLINRLSPKLHPTLPGIRILSTQQHHDHDDHHDNLGRHSRNWPQLARTSRG